MTPENEAKYREVAKRIDEWLMLHKGETFDLDLVCRQAEISSASARNYASQKLAYEVTKGVLEKNNKLYRYIDNTIKLIDWVNSTESQTINLIWPYDHERDTRFDFEDNVVVSPGDIVVVVGGSNFGKTTFCINLLWDNMDNYPCTLMGNEYSPPKFKRRVSRMKWASPINGNGQPKFELIERREGWKDIIRPDNINIIDWINLGDNFYQIGMIIDGIQSKLKNGIAVISLQKSPGKDRGLGGQFSEHLSSVYLSIDFEKLTVIKAKEWKERNPNGNVYGFQIVDGGTQFHNIRRMKKCNKCWGSGHSKGGECENCLGKGWIDD